MKLLAVLGLALAVVAMYKSTFDVAAIDKLSSDRLKLPPMRKRPLLELLKADPNNSDYCSKVFSMVDEGKVGLAMNQEVIFPLVRYCLETDKVLPLEKPAEMDVIYVAAFIFMFRVSRGEIGERMAERLYNAVMEKHFFVKFKAKLHEEPYTIDALLNFKNLTEKCDKQFFMLRTVKKYGKSSESKGVSQRLWLEYAELAALALVSMGFSREVLVAGLIALEKELPAGITPRSLSGLQRVFFSLSRGEYLRLEEPERIRLRAFLEKYLVLKLRGRNVLVETLPAEGLEQCEKVSELESQFKYGYLRPETIVQYASHFYCLICVEYPVFLLKKEIDFCSREPFSTKEGALDTKYCLLKALAMALVMVEEWGNVRLDKELVCSQIRRAIKECDEEISRLRAEFAKEDLAGMRKWERRSSDRIDSARNYWARFKERSKTCADLELTN